MIHEGKDAGLGNGELENGADARDGRAVSNEPDGFPGDNGGDVEDSISLGSGD